MNLMKIMLIVLCMIISLQASQSQIATPYANQIYAISMAVEPAVDALKTVLDDQQKRYADIVAELLKSTYQVVAKSEMAIGEFKTFETRAQTFRTQFNCMLMDEKKMSSTLACTRVQCEHKKACLSALVKTAKSFIEPLVINVFGTKITGSGKDTKIEEPGILLLLANAKFIPEAQSKLFVGQIANYTIQINKALGFLDVLAFAINPTSTPPKDLSPASAQEMLADQIIPVEADDEIVFE